MLPERIPTCARCGQSTTDSAVFARGEFVVVDGPDDLRWVHWECLTEIERARVPRYRDFEDFGQTTAADDPSDPRGDNLMP
jgi:hypothetical protein